MINAIKMEEHSEDKSSISGMKSLRISLLDSLHSFDRATVVGLNTSNELQGRLMGMGLTVGAKVEVLQGGNGRSRPLLIGVGESRIAIGRDIARMVLVESES
jgi:Fe2+ transport system protein FeoA